MTLRMAHLFPKTTADRLGKCVAFNHRRN